VLLAAYRLLLTSTWIKVVEAAYGADTHMIHMANTMGQTLALTGV